MLLVLSVVITKTSDSHSFMKLKVERMLFIRVANWFYGEFPLFFVRGFG